MHVFHVDVKLTRVLKVEVKVSKITDVQVHVKVTRHVEGKIVTLAHFAAKNSNSILCRVVGKNWQSENGEKNWS